MAFGIIPTASAFVPTNTNSQIAVFGGTISSMVVLDFLTVGNGILTVAGTVALLAAGWIHHRWETRHERHNYLGDEPYTFVDVDSAAVKKPEGNANWELTEFLRTLGVIKPEAIVTQSRSEQFRIFKIPSYHPSKIKGCLESIASLLAVNPDELFFQPVIASGTCAVMTLLPESEWTDVHFAPDQLTKGQLVGYVGKGIMGNHLTYNRKSANHVLVSGMTDSGKTAWMVCDMEAMRLSGVPVEIYIFDPKGTAQLLRVPCTRYIDDIGESVHVLENLRDITMKARRKKYAAANCDDWFEYRDSVDPNEPAIMIYIDELARYLSKHLTEQLEKGEHPRHKRAYAVLEDIIQMERSGGVFMTVGLQHPSADTLPTETRNQFGASVTLTVKDEIASRVAGVDGASHLPMWGGLIFNYQKRTVIGRGPYLKAA